MEVPAGCTICGKPFLVKSECLKVDVSPTEALLDHAYVTQCGHLYHYRCLEGALIHEKVALANLNLPSRRTCPNQDCQSDLSKTKLIKTNLSPMNPDENGYSFVTEIKRLQSQNANLRDEVFRLRSKDQTRTGEKVFVRNSNGTYFHGTITDVLVKVVKEPILTTKANDQDEHIIHTHQLSRSESFRAKVTNLVQDSVYPLDRIILARQFSRLETNNDMRTKWSAGDRVYCSEKQLLATIKWIGLREKTFKVLLEYDKPITTEPLNDEDLPCKSKPFYSKLLLLDDLYINAVKLQNEPGNSRSGFSRFNPLRRSLNV